MACHKHSDTAAWVGSSRIAGGWHHERQISKGGIHEPAEVKLKATLKFHAQKREREGTLKIWRQGHLELTGSVGLLSPALTANFFAFRPADSQGCHRELMTGP